MRDLSRFLSGTWQLTRLGWDAKAGRLFRMTGMACWSPISGGLLMEERGTLRFGSYQGEAGQRLIYRLETAETAAVCFEDGRPFHTLDLTAGTTVVVHPCGPDLYRGRYRVREEGCWSLGWQVTGPRKAYVSTTRFRRITGI